MTAANAVEEAARESKDLKIPYWRTLKADGVLNEKYPGGAIAPTNSWKRRTNHSRKRKKLVVKDYEKKLAQF